MAVRAGDDENAILLELLCLVRPIITATQDGMEDGQPRPNKLLLNLLQLAVFVTRHRRNS